MPYGGYDQGPGGTQGQQPTQPTGVSGASPGGGTNTPIAGVPGGTSGDVNAATNPQGTDVLNLLQQLFGPQFAASQAGSQDAIQSILQQLGFSNQQQDLSSSMAQQQAGFSLQNLGIDQSQLGIQQGANQRQSVLLPQLFDITQQGFKASEEQAKRGADVSTRNLNSSLTPSGAYTSVMGNAQRGDIKQQLADTLGGLGRQEQQSQLNFNEQVAQNKDSADQLNLMSQRLGISKEEIGTRLNNTLAQLGLQGKMTVAQLLGELGKVQAGEYSPVSQFMGDIYSISGLQMPASVGG